MCTGKQVLDVGTEGLAAFSLRPMKSEVEKTEQQHLLKKYSKVEKETGNERCYIATLTLV